MEKSIMLTTQEQVDAFENAMRLVQEDNGELVDCEEWAGSVKNGEVIRVLSQAYTGEL